MKARMLLCAIAAPAFLTAAASAQIAQWNFNSNPSDANTGTGTTVPNIGAGAIATIGGVTSSFSSGDATGGSTDPVTGDDSGWQTTSYAAQGANSGTAGIEAFVSTVGFQDIVVSWDQRLSNTSSRFFQFQYTLDGAAFSAAGLVGDGIFEATSGGDFWYNNRTVDLSAIAGASNNVNFGFRIVSIFDPALGNAYSASTSTSSYASTGTSRFDMVTIVPAPGALALMGLGALVGTRRRN